MVQFGRKIKKLIMRDKYVSKKKRNRKKTSSISVDPCQPLESENYDLQHIEAAGREYLGQLKRSERSFRSINYVSAAQEPNLSAPNNLDVLAYYLPQFHPFTENDNWWGKGFTEWTNVTKARPQFSGHYQPHLPSDLGFYDLRVKETMERQVELAKVYGITGFIFYYYWFNGHRLMERPLDQFLANKDIDFKFCLCWANENFSRRWDGSEAEVLLEQVHSAESDERFILDIIKYLMDPRYVTINDRPVVVVYRVGLLPHINETVKKWRQIAKRELGKDIFLIYATTFGENRSPEVIGFDAAIQFPPHSVSARSMNDDIFPFNPDYDGKVFDYNDLIPDAKKRLEKNKIPLIPAVFPSWDNTARRGCKGNVFINSTPDKYADWLSISIKYALNNPIYDRSIVAINAWNEWAEGAHLEPCQEYGHAYLRATSDTLNLFGKPLNHRSSRNEKAMEIIEFRKETKTMHASTAIIIHAYYIDVFQNILSKIPTEQLGNVFVTTSFDKLDDIKVVLEEYQQINTVFVNENRGRDILPFIKCLPHIKAQGYQYLIKLHTKKTVHRTDGMKWLHQLIDSLAPLLTKTKIKEVFEGNTQIGLIAPYNHVLDGMKFIGSPRNQYWIEKIASHYSIPVKDIPYKFPAGSMFAGRIDDFLIFSNDEWLYSQFEEERGQIDGTIAHALERFIGYALALKQQSIFSFSPTTDKLEEARANDEYEFANPVSY